MRLRFIGVFSLLVLLAIGCAKKQEGLVFSIPLPLTGANAKFGEAQKYAYMMAAEEINAAGGIKGEKLNLVFEDSQGKPEIARSITEKIIESKQPVIFGEYTSACAKAVAAVAEERKVPYLVVSSADDIITQKNYKYVYRLNPTNAYYANALMGFLKEVVKPKTIVILHESSDFGTSGAKAMEKDAKKAGFNVLLTEKYEKGAVDFKPLLSKVKALKPDVLFMVSYVMDASLLMKQIKELRMDAKVFAGGAAGFAIPEFLTNAGEAAEYVFSATLWSPKVKYPGVMDFYNKYNQKFNKEAGYHAALAYSAVYVIQDALIRTKEKTPDAIRDALKETNMTTVFGPVRFEDKDGYQNQNFVDTLLLQVQKGKFETVWPANFASAKYIYPIPSWKDRK